MKSTAAKIMVFLLLIGGICFSQNQISEAARYVFEKENARAVSYSVQNIQGFQNEFVLVNYASKDAANEYWLRLNLRKQGKILYDIKLDIDGTRYIARSCRETR